MAQCLVTCKTCETNLDVNWKCDSCSILCCYSCGETHVSLQKNKDHRVFNIKDTEGLPILKLVKCHIHKDKDISTYCQKCDRFMCTKCLSDSKNCEHLHMELEDLHAEKMKTLVENRVTIEMNFKDFFIKEGEKLKRTLKNHQENYESERQTITEHEKHLKDLMTLRINNLLKELDDHWKNIQHDVDRLTKILECKIQTSESKLSLIDEMQRCIDIESIYTVEKEIKEFVLSEDNSFVTQPNEIKRLQKGPVTVDELVGSLETESINVIDFKVQNSYTTDLESVDLITAVDDKTIWIQSLKDSIFRKIYCGEHLKTLNELKYANTIDITLLNSGDLLVSLTNDTHIKQLKQTGEVTTFYTFLKTWFGYLQLPLALHVNSEGSVCVGTMEKGGDMFNLSKSSHRQVVTLSLNGETLKLFEYDSDGNRLFTCPHKITSNKRGDVCVLDKFKIDEGRIVTLDSHGKLKWIYTGHSEIKHKFNSVDLVTTSKDNIIVCDFNNAFHIVNCQGQLLEYINTEKFKIESPLCLGLDHKGRLLIGCWQVDNNAKIYILLFTGC